MIPDHLDSWDIEHLIRCMNILQGRAETDHVQIGIFLTEETTFQTGVNTPYLWFLMEECFICFYCYLYKFAVRIHLPGRIAVCHFHFSASQLEYGLDGIGNIIQIETMTTLSLSVFTLAILLDVSTIHESALSWHIAKTPLSKACKARIRETETCCGMTVWAFVASRFQPIVVSVT